MCTAVLLDEELSAHAAAALDDGGGKEAGTGRAR